MAYSTINKSTLHFSPTLYVGNGSTKTVTGIPFEPDMTWIKNRSATGDNEIYDKLRGVGYRIYPNTSAGQDDLGSQGLTAWTSDGFTVGNNNAINGNGNNLVSWNWKAGTTSGISAGSQTITPTSYSINTTAGFGIYKWSRTGASTTDYFSHGLGATPTIAIQKKTDGVQGWYVNYTFVDGTMDYMNLNNTNSKFDGTTTVPTSTNYYPKSPETGDYITYLFTPIQGFSKFGSYTGNGNADGSFIYTGFKPALFLLKESNGTNSWQIFDNKRPGYNLTDKYLKPNENASEVSGNNQIDILSNGVKLRSSNTGNNGSGQNFIYMAFAEAPLVGSNNVPANAR